MLTVALASVRFCGAEVDILVTGRKALANDGVSTASKIADQAVKDNPNSAAAHEFRGEVLFRRGQFAQAEEAFRLAANLDSKYALAWWGLSRVSAVNSKNKTARDYIERAHALEPDDPRIFRDWVARLPAGLQVEAVENHLARAGRNADPAEVIELEQRLQYARAVRDRPVMVLASAYRPMEISLAALITDKTHMRSYGLEVSVNGKLLRLVLDTGAAGIVIPRKAAEQAGLRRLSQASMLGFGDAAKLSAGYRAIAERLRIGDLEYRDALISVSDQESVGTADGLIGTNIFAEFLTTLDFREKKLRLNPLPDYRPSDTSVPDRVIPPGLEHATPVFKFGHLLLLPTRVNGSREALFIIDSGADRTLISYDLANEVSKLIRDNKMRMSGINGQVADLYQTGNLVLQFAGFEQKNLGMSSIDTWNQSRQIGTEISGFLGLPVLDLFTLTIDYRDGLVNFERR